MPEEKAKNENIEQKDVKDLDKELSEFMPGASPKKAQTKQAGTQPKATKKRAVSKRPAAVRDKVISKGKRKRAIARVSITSGRGTILINGRDVELIKPKELKNLILEPITISPLAGGIAKASDIKVNVFGGGISGQAQAIRTALAKAMVKASNSEELRKEYMAYDRSIIVDDYRRVEPKKFLGPKARSRFQTSYR